MLARWLTLPLVFTALLSPLANSAPGGQDPGEAGPAKKPQEIERLEAWPALEKRLKSRLKVEIDKLRKASTEGMESSAREALAEMGAKVAPTLLASLGKERKEDARQRFASVLEGLVDARHTRLLSKHFDDRSVELRIFCMQRVSAFPDPGVREAAEKAWKKVKALEAKGRADEREVRAAALATMSSGSITALEAVFERTKKRWSKDAIQIHAACEGARTDEATKALLSHLKGTKQEQKAALRMLSGCGTKAALSHLKQLLDSPDQHIRFATVNALRGIVDGERPLEQMSVFDTIEEIDAWKKRI